MTAADPHGKGHVATAGASLARARLVAILAHGRGGTAEDILRLAERLAHPDVAYLAPQAAGNSWWPERFLLPLAANEPGLSSALKAFHAVVERVRAEGFADERIVLMGFSQGACLALEYAARCGRPFRGVAGLSGGLIGTADGEGPARDDLYGHPPKRFDYAGDLGGTRVYLGCHQRDPHIPLARVCKTAAVFEQLGAAVTTRIHPGAGHGILQDDVRAARSLLAASAP